MHGCFTRNKQDNSDLQRIKLKIQKNEVLTLFRDVFLEVKSPSIELLFFCKKYILLTVLILRLS